MLLKCQIGSISALSLFLVLESFCLTQHQQGGWLAQHRVWGQVRAKQTVVLSFCENRKWQSLLRN